MYVDTNVVLWLAGAQEQLSGGAVEAINSAEVLLFSPMVELEIEYLYEVGKICHPSATVIGHLRSVVNLQACNRSFESVVAQAKSIKWTRDPFDRLITGQAQLADARLLTRDKIIRANYEKAIW